MDSTNLVNNTAIYAFTLQGVSLATHLMHLLCAEEKKMHQNSFCDLGSYAVRTGSSSDLTGADEDSASSSTDAYQSFASSSASPSQTPVSRTDQTSASGADQTSASGADQTSASGADQTSASGTDQTSASGTDQTSASGTDQTSACSANQGSASATNVHSCACLSTPSDLNFASSTDAFSLPSSCFASPYSSASSTALTLFIPERLDVGNKHQLPLQKFSTLTALLEEQFTTYKYHIFIGAMGIVVRSIAPYIKSKTSDPAVVVIDQKGTFVISVLSGHIGNANEVTEYIAKKIHATPVITTATDIEGLPAIDSLATKNGLRIGTMQAAKNISAALLASKRVQLYDPDNWLQLENSPHKKYFEDISHSSLDAQPLREENTPIVIVTEKRMEKKPFTLTLAPPLFCAGIGCKRGTSAHTIMAQLTYAFEQKGLSLSSLHSLASVDVKKDEKGLLEAAEQLCVPLRFFSPEELNAYPTKNVSEKCLATFGIKGVCESAALAAAGKNAHLEQEKIAGKGVTIAIARRAKNEITYGN